jgi:hypothetical protein
MWHWYDIELVSTSDRHVCTYRIHVHWWHPGFWAECFRTLRDAGAGFFEALHLTAIAIVVFAKRKK